MNRLIIADIKSPVIKKQTTGHFFSVAKNYRDLFHDNIAICIAGGPIYSKQFQSNLLLLPHNIELTKRNRLSKLFRYLCNAKALFENCKNDTIVVQQGSDATFFAACSLLYHKNAGNKLYLIQYSTAALQSRIKRYLYYFAKSKIDGIICPSDEIGIAYERPYCVVPDYIYVQNDADTKTIAYETKQYDICFLGRIVEEKGIIEFLERFSDAPYKMIIAGRAATESLANKLIGLTKEHSNITLRLEFLSNEDYLNYLNQSRFCVLNYQGEYSKRSSGVVLDMIFHDVPVIGLDCKALVFIKQYQLGSIYDNLDSLNLKEIITQEKHKEYVRNISHYKQSHSEYQIRLFNFLTENK